MLVTFIFKNLRFKIQRRRREFKSIFTIFFRFTYLVALMELVNLIRNIKNDFLGVSSMEFSQQI